MNAEGAYLSLIGEVLEIAKGLGISKPAERLWTYKETEAVFSSIGIELCAITASEKFKSGYEESGPNAVLVFNANLGRSEQLAEIYRHLIQRLARDFFPDECDIDPLWAERAAKTAVRHWMRNLRSLTRENDLQDASEEALSEPINHERNQS